MKNKIENKNKDKNKTKKGKNTQYKKYSRVRAFTLIELLVVIAIIGILAAVVVAALGAARARADVASGETLDDSMHQNYGADEVAEWNFDDGPGVDGGNRVAADASGNHNDLTLDRSDSYGPSIEWASSTDAFRGASALVIPKENSSPHPATANITGFDPSNGSLSFWTNLSAGSSQAGIFCNGGDVSSAYQFCVVSSDDIDGNFIQVLWNGGGAGRQLSTSIPVDSVLGKWTHVALSWNVTAGSSSGSMSIYVNGHQAAAASYTPSTSLGLAPAFCVGGDCQGDNMVGSLDEMRVYSESL